MKCNNCGYTNKDGAKFCKHCGSSLDASNSVPAVNSKDNSIKYVVVGLTIVIIVLLACVVVMATGVLNHDNPNIQNNNSTTVSNAPTESVSSGASSSASSSASNSGSWVKIGSYSGSGSGSKSFSVPAGKIKIEISGFPIKNYADNHLSVSGGNGASAGVSWGPSSAVATRSDSLSYTSSGSVSFTIDYYEMSNWVVNVYSYQ